MSGYEFLKQYKEINKRICYNKECMLRAEKQAYEIGGKAQRWASDYQDRLYSETEDLIRYRFRIECAVGKCPCSETERELLFKRYIEGKKWTEIADEMNYSLQHLHRLNKSALAKVIVPRECNIDGINEKNSAFFIYN